MSADDARAGAGGEPPAAWAAPEQARPLPADPWASPAPWASAPPSAPPGMPPQAPPAGPDPGPPATGGPVPPGPPAAPPAGYPGAPGWQAMNAPATPYGAVITRRGIVAIKPLGLGDILDGSFRAIRHNPRVMIGVSLVIVVVTAALALIPLLLTFGSGFGALTDNLEDLPADADGAEVYDALAGPLASVLGGSAAGGVLTGLGILLLNGLLIVSVGQSVVDRRIGLGETWRRVRGRLLPLLLQSILIGLATGAPTILAIAAGTALVLVDPVLGVVVGLVLLAGALVLAVYLTVTWSLAPAALVLERAGVVGGLGRSRRLVRRAFWRTLGILLLTYVLTTFIAQVLATPIGLLAQIVPALGGPERADDLLVVSLVIAQFGGALTSCLVYPYLAGVVSLLYIDRRIRLEGLDVTLARALADRG